MLNLFWRKSADYKIISTPNLRELKRKFSQTWQAENLPEMQSKFTKTILDDYPKITAISALIELVKKFSRKNDRILEVGCSTGYLGKIFEIEKLKLHYEGSDYSKSFIAKAKELYPELKFKIDDATSLSYSDNQFDLVISGCCLLHIVNYSKAISEAARVAKKYVIFHRTPVLHFRKTTFATKHAYGVDMLEIVFNEGELADLFTQTHLSIVSIRTVGQYRIEGINEPILIKEYLCAKI